jgi:solute carrier family 25 iron transporter 28/37
MLPGVGALSYYIRSQEQSSSQVAVKQRGYTFPRDATGPWAAHAEEFDASEGMTFRQHMIAGAAAGIMEHIVMFPVDTVKTRMQAGISQGSPAYRSVFDGIRTIAAKEGITRLYRGMFAIASAAVPSHALYFATYEFCKEKLGGNAPGYHVAIHALSGAAATMAHDSAVTPLDVVKQRLQVFDSKYTGVFDVIRTTFRREGFRAFYASYPVTVLMNIPYMGVHFATYEAVLHTLTPDGNHSTRHELFAGLCAGALGGFVSTPFDVIKTTIQIDESTTKRDIKTAAREIKMKYGARGLMRGATARMLYFAPSAAICWTTYEGMKRVLGRDHDHDHDHDHHGHSHHAHEHDHHHGHGKKKHDHHHAHAHDHDNHHPETKQPEQKNN